MKGYLKDAAFIIAVVVAVKFAKTVLPLPASVTNLLP